MGRSVAKAGIDPTKIDEQWLGEARQGKGLVEESGTIYD
jgi:hypothetical protein